MKKQHVSPFLAGIEQFSLEVLIGDTDVVPYVGFIGRLRRSRSLGRRNSVRNDAADAGRIAEFLDVAPLARSPEAKRAGPVEAG